MRKEGLMDIYILEILDRYARENRRMTQRELLEYLEENHSICVTRKMLGGYLQAMRLEGYIKGQRGVYREAVLSKQEMRILSDSIWWNCHLPRDVKLYIMQRLERRLCGTLVSESSLSDESTGEEDLDDCQFRQTLSLLEQGIECQKKVRFEYYDYDVKGNLVKRGIIVGSPYHVVMVSGQYYLLFLDDWKTDIISCSLMRIRNVELMETKSVPVTLIEKYANGFDLKSYLKEHVDMTPGETCYATVKIRKKEISVLIDWYGEDYTIFKEDSLFVTVRFVVAEKALLQWAIVNVDCVEILGPQSIRESIRGYLDKLQDTYSGT